MKSHYYSLISLSILLFTTISLAADVWPSPTPAPACLIDPISRKTTCGTSQVPGAAARWQEVSVVTASAAATRLPLPPRPTAPPAPAPAYTGHSALLSDDTTPFRGLGGGSCLWGQGEPVKFPTWVSELPLGGAVVECQLGATVAATDVDAGTLVGKMGVLDKPQGTLVAATVVSAVQLPFTAVSTTALPTATLAGTTLSNFVSGVQMRVKVLETTVASVELTLLITQSVDLAVQRPKMFFEVVFVADGIKKGESDAVWAVLPDGTSQTLFTHILDDSFVQFGEFSTSYITLPASTTLPTDCPAARTAARTALLRTTDQAVLPSTVLSCSTSVPILTTSEGDFFATGALAGDSATQCEAVPVRVTWVVSFARQGPVQLDQKCITGVRRHLVAEPSDVKERLGEIEIVWVDETPAIPVIDLYKLPALPQISTDPWKPLI